VIILTKTLTVRQIVDLGKPQISEAKAKGMAFGAKTRVNQEKLVSRFVTGPYQGYKEASKLLK